MASDVFKIALFGNLYQEKKSLAVAQLLKVASELGVGIEIPEPFRDFLVDRMHLDLPPHTVVGDDLNADVVVCMGGDGTFLDVASRVGSRQIPILGINTGRLGFLANFAPDDIVGTLADLAAGRFEVEERSVIGISSADQELEGIPYALNEIAILKHDISAMITIHTRIDGEYLTTYQADGLIVGTPTGSTAYSLSVGGPIVVPQLHAMMLTPVAPHSLNMRPLVVSDTSVVDLRVKSRSGSFLVSLDGRSASYRDNIDLRIRLAPYKVKVITHVGHTFFSTLRQKMMWGIDGRENL